MAIGQINYGPVESLGRFDQNAPLRTGEAIARQYDPLKQLGNDIEVIGQKAQEEINNHEVRDAEVKLSYRLMDLEQQNAGKSNFNRDELPDYLTEGKTIKKEVAPGVFADVPVESFPAYDVYPALFRDRANAALVEEASAISDPKARKEFFDKFGLSIEEKVTNLTSQAGATRKAAFKAHDIQQASDAMDRGNFGIAQAVVQSSQELSEPEKIQLLDKIKTTQEASVYESYMLRDDITGMRNAIKNLQNPGYNGVFSMEQRKNYAAQMERELNRIRSERNAQLAGSKEILKYEIGKTIEAMHAGIPVATADLIKLQSRAKVLLDPGDQYKLADAIQTQSTAAAFAARPASERSRILTDFAGKKGGLTGQEASLLSTLTEVNQKVTSQERSDIISLAAQRGVVKVDPVTFDVQKDALANSLKARFQAYKSAQAIWGKTGAGPLTSGEAETLQGILTDPRGGINKQLEVFRQISVGFGGDTQTVKAVYDQLKEKGLGSLAVAGDLYAHGNLNGAREILEGAQLLKEKAVSLKNEQDYTRTVNDSLGGLYAHDPEKRASIAKAAIAAHVGRQARNSDLSGERTSSLGDIVSGITGAFKYKKTTIAAPAGVPPEAFRRWLDTVGTTKEYLDAIGPFAVKDASGKVAAGLRSGDYHLMTAADNEYLIVNGSGVILQQPNGQPYVYRYDPALDSRARIAAGGNEKLKQREWKKQVLEESQR